MAEESGELEYTEGKGLNLSKTDFDDRDDLLEIHSPSEEVNKTVPDDAEQIREQIEETRSQMSETIDAIQDKLSVANITEQVKDQVSEQIGSAVENAKNVLYDKTNEIARTVGRSFAKIGNSDLAGKVQENPWLVSVVGMGIGAILVGALFGSNNGRKKVAYSKNRSKNRKKHDKNDYTAQTRQQFKADNIRKFNYEYAPDKADSETNSVDENKRDSTYSTVDPASDSAYRTVSSAAGKTYENIGKASSLAYEKAGDLGEKAMKNYNHYITENPLAVGAVVFAVGAAIGYAIPLTKVENQYFGEMRDNMLETVKGSAQEAIETVKQTVGEAKQMIVDEVKTQTA